MTLTTIILLVLALYMVQIFLQETSRFGLDLRGIVGNRDNPPKLSVIAGRLNRAKNNMLESLPIFLALALLALVKGGDTGAVTRAASTATTTGTPRCPRTTPATTSSSRCGRARTAPRRSTAART